jgi:cytochrome oxidase Cu insertion factor (SCO1/SenC/PrrC family)
MRKTVVFLIIVGCAAAMGTAAWGATPEELMSAAGVQAFTLDLKAPGFELKALSGKTVKLKDYQGKVVLLFFYATW